MTDEEFVYGRRDYDPFDPDGPPMIETQEDAVFALIMFAAGLIMLGCVLLYRHFFG